MKYFYLCIFICSFNFQLRGQTVSKFIIVDQFGYLPESKKIAVLKNPQTGFDGAESFTPGSSYSLVNKTTGEKVFTAAPTSWKNGTTDISSGDKVWWFDFSSVVPTGTETYYVLDVEKNVKSFDFIISPVVYNEVLKQAVRTFFYQRAGHEKKAIHAGTEWADGASHIGPLQDKNARPYNEINNASKEVDVSGGWYDAGDYNKYTNWTANYVVDFMRAYLDAPEVWGDDYNIPESGNGFPDLLDEAKWGIDHLMRMQQSDGSVLSIVGLAHGSPPSSATGPSYYGTASTSAALNTSAAFAIASKVFGSLGRTEYSTDLKERAIKAWDWAEANPSVIFRNNDQASGTGGLGAGQQETDDYGRFVAKMEAACFLYEITQDEKYKDYFESNYTKIHLMEWNYAYPFETSNQEILLHYTTIPGITASVGTDIKTTYQNAMNGTDNFQAYSSLRDPYMAFIKDYTWGSNATKGSQGLMYRDLITYGILPANDAGAVHAAEGFIHYLHGVNPLNIVYLSNMYAFGGDNCVNEFYHTWFSDKHAKWDRVGTSTYGPAPGFVTGGPNPYYDWDGCCPSGCGGNNNALCNSESITPPKGQPDQKSYKDFNTSWPLNSWSVTENSNGYQLNYIRLLSHYIKANYDCNGTENGSAYIDACNKCAGGNTGVTPVDNPDECDPTTSIQDEVNKTITIFPNPSDGLVTIHVEDKKPFEFLLMNSSGKKVYSATSKDSDTFDFSTLPSGLYLFRISSDQTSSFVKWMKR